MTSTPTQPGHSEIYGVARIRILDGQLERFRALAHECVDIVRHQDGGTLEYRFFINEAGTEAFVHERYRDSAAGLQHMRNIERVTRSLAETCTMTGEICGEPSAELREALTAAGVTIYRPMVSAG